jgi:hypothetical protein
LTNLIVKVEQGLFFCDRRLGGSVGLFCSAFSDGSKAGVIGLSSGEMGVCIGSNLEEEAGGETAALVSPNGLSFRIAGISEVGAKARVGVEMVSGSNYTIIINTDQ